LNQIDAVHAEPSGTPVDPTAKYALLLGTWRALPKRACADEIAAPLTRVPVNKVLLASLTAELLLLSNE
jgi:hypothetical protein